jgi:hypothetical protein
VDGASSGLLSTHSNSELSKDFTKALFTYFQEIHRSSKAVFTDRNSMTHFDISNKTETEYYQSFLFTD